MVRVARVGPVGCTGLALRPGRCWTRGRGRRLYRRAGWWSRCPARATRTAVPRGPCVGPHAAPLVRQRCGRGDAKGGCRARPLRSRTWGVVLGDPLPRCGTPGASVRQSTPARARSSDSHQGVERGGRGFGRVHGPLPHSGRCRLVVVQLAGHSPVGFPTVPPPPRDATRVTTRSTEAFRSQPWPVVSPNGSTVASAGATAHRKSREREGMRRSSCCNRSARMLITPSADSSTPRTSRAGLVRATRR